MTTKRASRAAKSEPVKADNIEAVFDTMGLATAFDRLRYAAPVETAPVQILTVTIGTSSTPYGR